MRALRRHSRHRRAGFTLIEMLVAVAIFLALMAAVSLVFSLSVRLSEETFQKQEAFEIARAAMGVLEQDINRIYTSRDTGANSTFYGSPYGMTFIMKIQADNSSNFDLARVTYVFHRSAGSKVLQAQIDDNDPTQTDADRVRPTYSLIRYVEPGVEDLDTFPIDWQAVANPDLYSSTFQQVADALADNFASGIVNDLNIDCGPGTYCEEEMDRAAKREIWLRMMSGDAPVELPGLGTFLLPSAWDTVLDPNNIGLVPEDYILAENIVHLNAANGVNTDRFDPASPNTIYTLPIIQDSHFADDLTSLNGATSAGFFSYRELTTNAKRDDLQLGPNATAFPLTIVPHDSGGLPAIVENNTVPPLQEYVGIDLAYWGSVRNAEYQSRKTDDSFDPDIDHDRDGNFPNDPDDEAIALANLRNPAAYIRTGSPLDPRLPEAVNVRFTLFLQAPTVSSPDYFETFTQRIPVPLGYRRPNEVL